MKTFFGTWRCNCTDVQTSKAAIARFCPNHNRELLGPVAPVNVPKNFALGVEGAAS